MTNRSADIGTSGVTSIASEERYRPYPAYKDSGVEWLGEIPAHWEVKQLRWAITFQRGHDLPSEDREEGDVPVVSSSGISSMHSKAVAKAPGIVTGRCGTIGQFYLINQSYWPLNTALYSINLHGNESSFLLYMLIHMSPLFFLHSIKSAVPAVDRKDVHEDHTAVPHLSEQRAIAAFLDRETTKIDALVAKKERLIELLQEKRTALISHAVTKGLDPDVPLKDSGVEWLEEIPAHWEVKRLKHLLIEPLKYGANEPAVYTDHNLPRYIRITDIREDGTLRDDSFRSIPEEIAKPYLLVGGDILFARSGATVGKTFQYDPSWGKAAYAGYLIRARLKECAVESDFVEYFTQSQDYTNWLLSNFIQATIQNVSAERYATLSIPLPLLLEQRAIIAFLDRETAQIDALVAKVQEAIDRLKELRTSLISAAVTGKIDVREDAA